MKLIKCDKCQSTFTSQFCPDCGQNRNDIKKVLPIYIDTYVHDQMNDEHLEEFELGENLDTKLVDNFYSVNYEVGLTYEIVGDNYELRQVQLFNHSNKIFNVVETKNKLR